MTLAQAAFNYSPLEALSKLQEVHSDVALSIRDEGFLVTRRDGTEFDGVMTRQDAHEAIYHALSVLT